MGIPPKEGEDLGAQMLQKLTSGFTQLVADAVKKQKITKPKPVCTHNNGAIKVAEYIVKEIKQNVKSKTADQIRYWIDTETYKQRVDEWDALPWYAKMDNYPETSLSAASTIWFMKVKTKSDWDHKPKIRDQFTSVAVARPLFNGNPSKSYYHKHEDYDYFYDVWSNIHYGYVGLSVGFGEDYLLMGASIEQIRTNIMGGPDPIDDVTAIKIGYALYKKFGKYAEGLTAQDVLNALKQTPNNLLPESRATHWCWNSKNPDPAEKPSK